MRDELDYLLESLSKESQETIYEKVFLLGSRSTIIRVTG